MSKNPSNETIALVSCVKRKTAGQCAAKDLYTSALFRYQRAYAEKHADRWFILSAKYGLIHPDAVIEPYEQTLTGASVATRREWARRVFGQMESAGLTNERKRFLWLAGQAYQRELSRLLHAHEHAAPLTGMRIGERLAWLKAQAEGGAAAAPQPIATARAHHAPAKLEAVRRERKPVTLRRSGASKYQPLADFLRKSAKPVIRLTFAEVAALVGGLPTSAFKYAAWWSDGGGHPQSQLGWLAAGYRVESFDRGNQMVTFRLGG